MAKLPHEILPKISIAWVGRTNDTDRLQTTDDRQTDRQTDGRPMTYSEHELEFTFANKIKSNCFLFLLFILMTNCKMEACSVASLGWVTPGAATEGVTPPIFSWKAWRPFFAHHCHYHYRFYCFHSGVTPVEGVTPHLFLPDRPRFCTILCKFAHKFFSFGCHPPGRCHPGRSGSAPPLVTPLGLLCSSKVANVS